MLQKEVLDILKTGASVFLTGEPGSGKTHVIREYIRYLRSVKIDVAVTASTGIAATHLGGVTINSWSGIGIKKILSKYDLDYIASNEYLVKRITKTKVLIIDEVSMLDGSTLDSIERVCRAIKQSELPFGGMQTVLVGDFFQLPPVARQGEPPAKFAFDCAAWFKGKFLVCYLHEQFRQSDQDFLNVLSAVRKNAVTDEHLAHLDKRCVELDFSGATPAPGGEARPDGRQLTRLYSHNLDVDNVNNEALKKIPGEAKIFKMETTGRRILVDQIKRGCLSPETLVLKKDAVVMFTKNSPKGLFVNGTLGRVVEFNSFSGMPVVKTKDGRKIETEKMDWAIDDNGRVLARVSQIPLRLAWALTVHKSQGMSLDVAFIDLRTAFVAGQGYVALSRVRTLQGLFLCGYNKQALLVHPEVLVKDVDFRAQSEALSQEFSKLSAEELEKMHRNYIQGMGGVLKTSGESEKKYSLEIIREKFKNAYAKWTEEDDKLLAELFGQGRGYKDMANHFGRKTGAITARLKKLKLIEE
ncbi:MAG: PIF1 family DEAD/DEAH box helicase [bacterium]|nr:PIF1 family DEAD/DEAH box helicase [bacterium]